jgi:hypothetical protein
MKVPWVDALHYWTFREELESRYRAAFGAGAEVTTTGILPLLAQTIHAAMLSAARSYLIAGFERGVAVQPWPSPGGQGTGI